MTKGQKKITSPGVLMLMGQQCAYCGPMMQVLTEIMKSGAIGELRIVNIEKDPELAQQHGVRSVPWLQIGPFELLGSRSRQEIELWLQRASDADGINEYIAEVLTEGKIDSARKLIKNDPAVLENIIELMADADAKINVRLGVGVIIEEMAESSEFEAIWPLLRQHLSSADARVRGDACHYLSLTKNTDFIPDIEKLLTDESDEVREIAQDSLDDLRDISSI